MADFTTFKLEVNVRSTASPNYHNASGTNREVRFSDASTAGETTASASWPFTTRPSSGTAAVPYVWVYTADAIGAGVYGGSAAADGSAGSAPATFATTQYLMARWSWDNLGTFASAPIFTAYPSSAHGAVTRGDGSLLGGHASDTGATARSYLKGAMFGRVSSAGAPAAGPGSSPTVTDGTTGSISPSAGANWSAWQGLQGDNDYITFPSTPAAVTADTLHVMFELFMGANMTPGTWVPVLSARYTWT